MTWTYVCIKISEYPPPPPFNWGNNLAVKNPKKSINVTQMFITIELTFSYFQNNKCYQIPNKETCKVK